MLCCYLIVVIYFHQSIFYDLLRQDWDLLVIGILIRTCLPLTLKGKTHVILCLVSLRFSPYLDLLMTQYLRGNMEEISHLYELFTGTYGVCFITFPNGCRILLSMFGSILLLYGICLCELFWYHRKWEFETSNICL